MRLTRVASRVSLAFLLSATLVSSGLSAQATRTAPAVPPLVKPESVGFSSEALAKMDEGMQALNKAVEMKPDYFEAISYINLLYREKAKMETDPAKKQEYTDLANKYLQQALDMRKAAQEKAKAEAAQATPEPGR